MRRLAIVVGTVIAAAVALVVVVRDHDVPARAAATAAPVQPATRAPAAPVLPDPATPGGVRRLADTASSQDRLAAHAANALGAVHDPAAAPDLAEVATSDAPMITRANAARALAASGGPDQAPVLARLVASPDQPARVRQEAALALGRIGGPAQVPALVAALDTPDEQIRISVEQALGALGTPAARQALTERARASLSPTERAFVRAATSHP